MKFANLILDEKVKMINIGDYIQILAIENLYKYIGVNYDEVIRIKVPELSTYDGDYVVLPISYPFYGYYELSNKIKPVFLGLSLMSNTAAAGLKLKQFEPIGCRDIHTFKILQEIGIDSYYGGCLTLTFPKKETPKLGNKIFMVDIPNTLKDKLPKHISEKSEFLTQVFYNDDCIHENDVKKIYERYKNEATMVVTSRIHCALPCIAAGIPTIFVCKEISFRYTVLQNLLPIYTEDQFDIIDWNPQPIELEDRKKLVLNFSKNRILQTFNKYEMQSNISNLYENTKLIDYKIDTVSAIIDYINQKWNKESHNDYILWGVTQITEVVFDYISNNYPKAKLAGVIDMYRNVDFHGLETSSSDILINNDSTVFVTAGAANTVAEDILKKYNVNNFVICYNGLCVIDGKRISL